MLWLGTPTGAMALAVPTWGPTGAVALAVRAQLPVAVMGAGASLHKSC